jgi:hypothetical protein
MPSLDPGQSRLARMLSNAGSAFAAVTLTTPPMPRDLSTREQFMEQAFAKMAWLNPRCGLPRDGEKFGITQQPVSRTTLPAAS